MKAIINDYEDKDIARLMREWTELTQKDFAASVFRSLDSIKKIETGQRNLYLHTFLEWVNKHNIKITIEKK